MKCLDEFVLNRVCVELSVRRPDIRVFFICRNPGIWKLHFLGRDWYNRGLGWIRMLCMAHKYLK